MFPKNGRISAWKQRRARQRAGLNFDILCRDQENLSRPTTRERDCVDTIPPRGYDEPTNSKRCESSTLGRCLSTLHVLTTG